MAGNDAHNDETVAIAVLMGFNTRPADGDSAQELYRRCEAAAFAYTRQDLPHGNWARHGYAFERAATITVRRTAALTLCQRPNPGRARQW